MVQFVIMCIRNVCFLFGKLFVENIVLAISALEQVSMKLQSLQK